MDRFDRSGFHRFRDFDWSKIDQEALDDTVVDALRTAMLVEDHIPNYTSAYLGLFPLEQGLPLETLSFRRQMLRFVFRWAADEDRHAHVLKKYILSTGRVDPSALETARLKTVAKTYQPPHREPLALAVYTAVQEKATQLFYASLRDSVKEPVLVSVLDALNADEARHCGFFVDLLRAHLKRAERKDILALREAVEGFKMPLSETIDGYRRRSVGMMRVAGGYHYREGFVVLKKALESWLGSRADSDIEALLTSLDPVQGSNGVLSSS